MALIDTNITHAKGNGHAFPISRKAFNRGLPRRVGAIEDLLDNVALRLTAVEAQPAATASVEADNAVEIIARLMERLRSKRSRRRLSVSVGPVTVSLG